ncbi:MAG: thioredoxin [SAR202 cluster bacterium]|nr:thioredoxin [SAR202 cluster bacterium]
MATVNLKSAEFEGVISKPGMVIVDFWAAWCGPCRQFAPVFEAASEKYPEIVFAKVDTDAEQEISAAVGILSIPTLMIFKDGILIFNQPGALPAPALEEIISKVNELDMDGVRAEIEKSEATKSAD